VVRQDVHVDDYAVSAEEAAAILGINEREDAAAKTA
jgi:hypothetical protein